MPMRRWLMAIALLLMSATTFTQETTPEDNPECTPQRLAEQQQLFLDLLTLSPDDDPQAAAADLYRLGALYQNLALTCGYQPTEPERDALIQTVLGVADVETILAANAVGTDVDTILAELETVTGDSFNGQLLYSGMQPALDGSELGCAGCHAGDAAPNTEGTWTRVDEIRLELAQFSDYDHTRYLVESIVLPNAYIVPDYQAGLMPTFYGSRLDVQQMADLIAYLNSQDQRLDELD